MLSNSAPSALPPADADEVLQTFRFGWALAELRGRYRPDVEHVEDSIGGSKVKRTAHALALGSERSSAEQRIGLENALAGWAKTLSLNFPNQQELDFPERLAPIARTLSENPADKQSWDQLTENIYLWDIAIQDRLVLKPSQSAAYQLGRGLAETFWELDPAVTDADDARCWTVVLGSPRRAILARLLARLSGYMDPLTIPAVTASLAAWVDVASSQPWRTVAGAPSLLFQQGLLWHDLICGERRPQDLEGTRRRLGGIGVIMPVLRSFWPQVVLGGFAVAALVFGAAELAAGNSKTHASAVITILGGVGITSAGLYARAKAAATSLFSVLRSAFEADRVGQAAMICPKPPVHVRTKPKRFAKVASRRLGTH
jgi:hypothetical protein